MMAESNWANWLERLYDLRRDKRDSHERPHKPVLLLAVIDLIDRGEIAQNKVPLSDALIRTFKEYFRIVRRRNDQPTIQNPFFHLSGDGFWHLKAKALRERIYRPGEAAGSPSLGELRRRVAYASFDTQLWSLLTHNAARHQLRDALIARYFPEDRSRLAALSDAPARQLEQTSVEEQIRAARDTAFRRTILELYDHRCAACGIRVLVTGNLFLAEAAHLIPFNVSQNDRPDNGMALCPNHHWAMDQRLIAPCPDKEEPAGTWRVSPVLDDRLEGQRDLIGLRGRPVIPPNETKFYPAETSLRWRAQHLRTKSEIC